METTRYLNSIFNLFLTNILFLVLLTNSLRQNIWLKSRSVFVPFIFLKVYKQVYTKFIPDFYTRQELVRLAGGIKKKYFGFFHLHSSFCEGGLQQIQKIGVQALRLSSNNFVEEKMIHALQTNRPQSWYIISMLLHWLIR